MRYLPYLKPTVGVALLAAQGAPASELHALGSFATAQGGQPALLHPGAGALRGTREGIGFPSLQFGGIGGGPLIQVTRTVSQGIFRPSRLVVVDSQVPSGVNFQIDQILVGSESCLVNENGLTAAMFVATGVECGITFPTAGPGITIAITVENLILTVQTAHFVNCTMLGEYIRGGGAEIGG